MSSVDYRSNEKIEATKRDLDKRIQMLRDKIEVNEGVNTVLRKQLADTIATRNLYVK